MADMKVVPLRTRPDEIKDTIVEILEDALEKARNGEFKAIAVAAVGNDNSVTTFNTTNDCMPTLIGASTLLTSALLRMANTNKV